MAKTFHGFSLQTLSPCNTGNRRNNIMRQAIKGLGVILTLFSISSIGLPAVDRSAPSWQALAVEGMELVQEGGLENFEKNLPLLWSESEPGRRFFSAKNDKERLLSGLIMLESLPLEGRKDSRVLRTIALCRAALGFQGQRLVAGLAEGPMDWRQEAVDLALFYADLQLAEEILADLEREEVRPEWVYRRAVIAGRRGETMLAASLWREALSQGLPLTPAVIKELGKAGLHELAGERRLPRNIEEYHNTVGYLARREGNPSEALYPGALRRGNEAYEQQRYEEAIREWKNVLTNQEHRGKVSFLVGQAMVRLRRMGEARDAFREVLREQPSFFLPYLGMAQLLKQDGKAKPAKDWLDQGYFRTGARFLANGAGGVRKVYFPVKVGPTRETVINLNGLIAQDADGAWLSWNQGRDWLWYPWLHGNLQVPRASEYWVVGTRGQGIVGEVILIPTGNAVPQARSQIRVQTGNDRTIELAWNWEMPVTIRVEYWAAKGPRRRLPASGPETSHRLVLDVEPGLTYRFRALAYAANLEVALEEGEFTTQPRQYGLGFSITGGAVPRRLPQVEMVVKQPAADEFQVRMAEGESRWSPWRTVLPEMRWDLTPGDGVKTLKFQYKDAKGNVSPALTERVILDTLPPTVLLQSQKGSRYGTILSFSTNELAVASLWVKQKDQWQLLKKTDDYSITHEVKLPKAIDGYQIWLEDRAGNIMSVLDPLKSGQERAAMSLRINNGAVAVRGTRVRLQTVCPVSNSDFPGKIRFSNDGRIWSPWQTIKDEYSWRISSGEGPKRVLAQVQTPSGIYPLKAETFLDLTLPSPEKVTFKRVAGQVVATWETAEPAKSRFYLSGNGIFRVNEDSELKKEHRVVLGALNSQRYAWRLESYDAAGNQVILDGGEFRGDANIMAPPVLEREFQQITQSNGFLSPLNLGFQAEPPKAFRRRYSGRPWSDWILYDPSLPWSLKNGMQQRGVELQFSGAEGNISPYYQLDQRTETSPPRVYNVRFEQHQNGLRLTWSSDKPATAWVLGVATADNGVTPRVQQVHRGFGLNGEMELGRLNPGFYRFRIFPRDTLGNWGWTSWVIMEVKDTSSAGLTNL